MALSPDQLSNILGNARQLCTPQADKMFNQYKGAGNPSADYDPDPAQFDDLDRFDAAYSAQFESKAPQQPQAMSYTQNQIKKSNMNENIKQSMLNNPIDVSAFDNTSVLSRLNVPTPERKVINENTKQQIQFPTQNTGVDYSIIKAIVNDCIKENLLQLNNGENGTLSTIGIKKGTITIVDNKGNVYKAKLEKIKDGNEQ